MICIIHKKEDKKIASQIAQSLRTKGYDISIEKISKENSNAPNKNIELAILIFTKNSNLSPQIVEQYVLMFEKEVPIIPFVTTDMELSVSMQHFFFSHDWINAFDIPTKKAINDLQILIQEITGEKQQPDKNKKNTQNKNNTEQQNNKKQKYIIAGVAIIFLTVILYFLFTDKNANNKNNNQNNIVGSWRLAKYEDNMTRTGQELVDYISSIDALKKNFSLTFNENETFEKLGLSQPETGRWQFDPQNMILYMWPQSEKLYKDQLKIEKLTPDTLIMIIASQIDSLTLINTKFTLYKE